jgi:hypothetical protein
LFHDSFLPFYLCPFTSNLKMLTHKIYYQLKPFIPRSLQIVLRRGVVLRKRKSYTHIWPVDEEAGRVPEGWLGWPNEKRFALILTHDVDTAKGQEKCYPLFELEQSLGFRSSFNFVPKRYQVSSELRHYLVSNGFEVGVHGLYHDGKLYKSREVFQQRAGQINHYLREWQSVGFRSPAMHHNLEWISELEIEYDSSTFDTDPFEPQPDGMGTIFPFWVPSNNPNNPINPSNPINSSNLQPPTACHMGYVELPYTLPQDHCLFIILQEKDISIWKKKLDWIAESGGMALLNTHPDYMNFDGKRLGPEEYPAKYYEEFLEYTKSKYEDQFWNVLPQNMARFWKENYLNVTKRTGSF